MTRDVEFHGVQLKQGDMVYGLVSAANRDPRALRARATSSSSTASATTTWASPAARTGASGMHLARREMQIAVEEWLRLIPDFDIERERASWSSAAAGR